MRRPCLNPKEFPCIAGKPERFGFGFMCLQSILGVLQPPASRDGEPLHALAAEAGSENTSRRAANQANAVLIGAFGRIACGKLLNA